MSQLIFLPLIALSLLAFTACGNGPIPSKESPDHAPLSPMLRPSAPQYVPGEVLVKFKPTVSEERIGAILKEHQIEKVDENQGLNVYRTRITSGASVESTVKRLSSLQDVEYAEPNYIQRAQ